MFKKQCALRTAGTRFYVSGHQAKKYSARSKIFKMEYLSKIVAAKMKKHLSSCHKNHHISYAFVSRRNRKLKLNLLPTLRATFSKIRASISSRNIQARYQRYPLELLVNAPAHLFSITNYLSTNYHNEIKTFFFYFSRPITNVAKEQ